MKRFLILLLFAFCISIASAGTENEPVADANTTQLLLFNEGSGDAGTNLTDSSGNGNNGTLGVDTWVNETSAGWGWSVNTTASDDARIAIGNNTIAGTAQGYIQIDFIPRVTYSAASPPTNYDTIFRKALPSAQVIRFQASGGGYPGQINWIADGSNQWFLPDFTYLPGIEYILVFSWNATHRQFFRNGVLIQTTAVGVTTTGSAAAYIGGVGDPVINATIRYWKVNNDTYTPPPPPPANYTNFAINRSNAYREEWVNVSALWNFSNTTLVNATLQSNIYGSWQDIETISLSGTAAYSNFHFQMYDTAPHQVVGFRILAWNQTISNTTSISNVTILMFRKTAKPLLTINASYGEGSTVAEPNLVILNGTNNLIYRSGFPAGRIYFANYTGSMWDATNNTMYRYGTVNGTVNDIDRLFPFVFITNSSIGGRSARLWAQSRTGELYNAFDSTNWTFWTPAGGNMINNSDTPSQTYVQNICLDWIPELGQYQGLLEGTSPVNKIVSDDGKGLNFTKSALSITGGGSWVKKIKNRTLLFIPYTANSPTYSESINGTNFSDFSNSNLTLEISETYPTNEGWESSNPNSDPDASEVIGVEMAEHPQKNVSYLLWTSEPNGIGLATSMHSLEELAGVVPAIAYSTHVGNQYDVYFDEGMKKIEWYRDGTLVQTTNNSFNSTYTSATGTNITAIGSNRMGGDSRIWSNPPTLSSNSTWRTFSSTWGSTVNVTWYINGTVVQTNASVTSASYTNSTPAVGTWNVTGIAGDAGGNTSVGWTWIIQEPTSTTVVKEWTQVIVFS